MSETSLGRHLEQAPRSPEFGVFEETEPLRQVLMWGEPGAEAVLAQLLPTKDSCFYTQFDVLAARQEFTSVNKLLESRGVQVVLVKDLYARMVEEKGLQASKNLAELRQELQSKGEKFYEGNKELDISDISVLTWLDQVLLDDVERYGENTAIAMNDRLCNSNYLPMANVVYARDQSNLIGNTWVWSSMKHPIRQPEIDLYREVLEHAGIADSHNLNIVSVRGNGRFEGGDAISNRGISYIGIGGRTNLEGVRQVAGHVLKQGIRLLAVVDEERDTGARGEMDAMHLDTIWMPSGRQEVVACIEEIERRKLLEIKLNASGSMEVINHGWFVDHLARNGVDIIPITKPEQEKHAPNFLNLGNDQIILSLPIESPLSTSLEQKGKQISNANLINITKGYGGLHCMTAAIKRG